IDLNHEVQALEPILRRMAGDGVQLDVQPHPDACFVQIDKVHLEQVVANLVINARDAMPSGGKLVVQVGRCDHPEAQEDGALRMVEASVTDSGVGMDAETRERMFDPFYTTKGQKGTGLGLATVDGIVGRLGGQIRVRSEPGRGTQIRVYLPEASTRA